MSSWSYPTGVQYPISFSGLSVVSEKYKHNSYSIILSYGLTTPSERRVSLVLQVILKFISNLFGFQQPLSTYLRKILKNDIIGMPSNSGNHYFPNALKKSIDNIHICIWLEPDITQKTVFIQECYNGEIHIYVSKSICFQVDKGTYRTWIQLSSTQRINNKLI